ncbi:MAG: hypothetical protein E7504_00055 [Ruminococcus sp.]|nr:hypothetical protein [Ruminococcus sp.]
MGKKDRKRNSAAAISADAENTDKTASSAEIETAQAEDGAAAESGGMGVLAAVGDFLDRFGWIFLLIGSVLLIGYYILLPSRAYFHSDTTDTLMWAAASYEGGTLFNRDFTYACLLPFGTSLIMTALIPIFGVSMTTHVLGMLVFFLLFTAALIWMCRTMQWSWKWTSVMVFAVLTMLLVSEKLREIFWGHTIYYSLGVLFIFVGLGLVFRYMDLDNAMESSPQNTRKYFVYIALIGIWFLLTGTNQVISMTIFALPTIAAVFCERWLDTGTKLLSGKNRRTVFLIAIMMVCMLIGYLITSLAAIGIHTDYQNMHSNYSAMSEWVNNLHKFPEQWLSLLGVEMKAGDPLLSSISIQNLLKLIAGLVILILPLIALCFYKKIEDVKLRILILTHWFMTALIMLGYICGKLSSANWRLSPIAAMCVVVSVAFLRWALPKISLQRIISLLMIPVFLSCLISTATILCMPPMGYKETELYKIAEILEENGLSYGYASFWRANSITVISDSKSKCRSVSIGEGGVEISGYQAMNSWYQDQPGQDKYFLLMSQQEKEGLLKSKSPILEKTYREVKAGNYVIWIFYENIIVK